MDKYLLSRVVMPQASDAAYRDLFFRRFQIEAGGLGKTLTTFEELHFSTWMNLFSAKKWYHYCDLGTLYLGVQIKGAYSIEITGSNRNVAYIRLDERMSYHEYEGDGSWVYIPVEDAAAFDGVYFILRYRKDDPCEIGQMGWFTDKAPGQQNKMAIVTCTFKRENYIKKTISMFENYLENNEALQDRLHLFVVDNGQTLDTTKAYKYTNIFHNINAGGAGGFGRGLMEVCKAQTGYTRCLFMDDDVEIIPESFYRTLTIADYLKNEYQDAFINGAMLDIYHKTTFFENLAIRDGLWVRPYHGQTDLLNYDEILRVTKIPDEIFHKREAMTDAAWWYCCFPVDQKTTINTLPLPIFIRGDDVEWGWRNFGNVRISMNGICVWHAPFYYRIGKTTEAYYLSRNMFIVNMLYTENFKQTFKKMYIDRFHYLMDTYDYVSAKLTIKALGDVLQGSSLFEQNPVAIMAEISAMAKEDIQNTPDEYELMDVKNKTYFANRIRRLVNKIFKKIFRKMPWTKDVVKRSRENVAPEWYPPVEAFQYKKRVKVYNLMKHTAVMRTFDRKLEKDLTAQFHAKLNELETRYDALKEEYEANFKKLTSCDFWEKYLQLK